MHELATSSSLWAVKLRVLVKNLAPQKIPACLVPLVFCGLSVCQISVAHHFLFFSFKAMTECQKYAFQHGACDTDRRFKAHETLISENQAGEKTQVTAEKESKCEEKQNKKRNTVLSAGLPLYTTSILALHLSLLSYCPKHILSGDISSEKYGCRWDTAATWNRTLFAMNCTLKEDIFFPMHHSCVLLLSLPPLREWWQ